MVREKRDSPTQTLGFPARRSVVCGLPIRRPQADQFRFARRNGHFRLQLAGTRNLDFRLARTD